MAIIDLTHPLETGMPIYPGDQAPTFSPVTSFASHGYSTRQICLTTHSGTHIDAPAHCLPGAKTLDQYPICHFVGPAQVLDCRQVRGEITLSHIGTLGSFLDTDFLLILTGWDYYWGTAEYFTGFPVLSAQAANWLAAQPIKGIGIDTPSVDAPDAPDLPNHRRLLGREIVIIENLTHLDAIPNGKIHLYCLPLRITDSDAAPARIIASC